MSKKLKKLGSKNIIITGVEKEDKIGAIGYDGQKYCRNFETKYNVSYHGTGDVFTSALSGSLVLGKTIEEAREIIKTFIEMIKREEKDEEKLKKLEDAIAFKNISNMPARVKCALLAWHTLDDLI